MGRPDPAQDRESRSRRTAQAMASPKYRIGRPAYFDASSSRCSIAPASVVDDRAPDLEVAERLPRVVAEERDPRIAAHVPLLREAAHRVDPDALAVEVAPHDRGLRIAVRHDRGQDGDRRAFDQVAVGRGDLVGGVIAGRWFASPSPPRGRGPRRSPRRRVGRDEVSEGLHDFCGSLRVRVVAGALDGIRRRAFGMPAASST